MWEVHPGRSFERVPGNISHGYVLGMVSKVHGEPEGISFPGDKVFSSSSGGARGWQEWRNGLTGLEAGLSQRHPGHEVRHPG
jgi:hypothetical protein